MLRSLTSLPLRTHSFVRSDVPDSGLNILLFNAGHEIRRQGETYDWDGTKRGERPLFIWQYTLAGRGRLRFEGKERDILPGDAMLLKIPEFHRYWLPEDSESWEFVYVTGSGTEWIRLGLEARAHLGTVVRHTADAQVVRTAASLISAAAAGRLKNRYDISSRAYAFMMDLLAETSTRIQSPNERAMEKAREYCMTHVSEPVSVDDLARSADLSRWHFSRCFKKISGIPPHRYIMETKMGYAAHLLLNTGFSVKEIAVQSGFTDTSYFCKSFKHIHGISPGMFRAM